MAPNPSRLALAALVAACLAISSGCATESQSKNPTDLVTLAQADSGTFWTLFATVTASRDYAREDPSFSSPGVLRLVRGETYTAVGRSRDGRWLQVRIPGHSASRWVPRDAAELSGDIGKLDLVSVAVAAKAMPTATAAPPSSPTPSPSPSPTPSPTASLTPTAIPTNTVVPTTAVPATTAPPPTETTTAPPTAPPTTTHTPTATQPPPPTATPAPTAAPTVAPAAAAGNFELGGQVSDFRAPDLMRNAGMTWVKRQVKWHPGEPSGGHIGVITDAHAKGFKILLSVLGSPDTSYPQNFGDYARFAGELAAAGADAIEVWNEMNLDREWASGSINPTTYTSLLQQAHASIKAANGGTMVISGAPAPTGYFGGCHPHGCDDAPFISGMVAAGGLNYVDCIGIHYNEGLMPPSVRSGDPRGASSHYTRYYPGMVDTYFNAVGGARPLCFTEIGYLSGEEWGMLPAAFLWQPPYNLSVTQHAQYLADAVRLSRAQGKVRLFIIFNVDFTHWSDDPQAGYAIMRPGGNCPACTTLQAAMSGN